MKDLKSGIEHLKQAKAHMSKANGIMSNYISKLKSLEEENGRLKDELSALQIQPDASYMKLPVDADGKPIHIGDKMDVDGDCMTVLGYRLYNGELLLVVEKAEGDVTFTLKASSVRHFKHDSWERIAGDIKAAEGWCDKNGDYGTGIVSISEQKLREWSDRIRKLAAKEGE